MVSSRAPSSQNYLHVHTSPLKKVVVPRSRPEGSTPPRALKSKSNQITGSRLAAIDAARTATRRSNSCVVCVYRTHATDNRMHAPPPPPRTIASAHPQTELSALAQRHTCVSSPTQTLFRHTSAACYLSTVTGMLPRPLHHPYSPRFRLRLRYYFLMPDRV